MSTNLFQIWDVTDTYQMRSKLEAWGQINSLLNIWHFNTPPSSTAYPWWTRPPWATTPWASPWTAWTGAAWTRGAAWTAWATTGRWTAWATTGAAFSAERICTPEIVMFFSHCSWVFWELTLPLKTKLINHKNMPIYFNYEMHTTDQ